VAAKQRQISERELKHWRLLDRFRQALTAKRKSLPGEDKQDRLGGPERKLLEEDYFSLMLFGFFNPVLESMRGLCAASNFAKVQQEVCSRAVSLGSFSEAQHVCDPNLLKEVFEELARDFSTQNWGDDRLKPLAQRLKLIDGSLLPALPRMFWALWVDDEHRAAKLHLKFNVLTQSPCEALVTAGNRCERKTLRKMLRKGEILVGDRYYGLEYGFFNELRAVGVSTVFRIRNEPKIHVIESLELNETDRQAGVVWQAMVELGDDWQGPPIRLVRVCAEGKELLLATDLELDAELIALIYRYRWQIELLFKWLKSLLGCRHLLAESPRGVAIQVYCALIAALLLQSLTGKRPNKRAMEAFMLHQMGLVSEEELVAALGIEKTLN
jgi:hypothetical protein